MRFPAVLVISKLSSRTMRFASSSTKAPTWQGEVWKDGTRDEAFKRDRVKKEKHRAFEGGAVGPVVTPMNIVRDNAVPKLADDRSNLVVIADDMRVSPVGVPGLAEWGSDYRRRGRLPGSRLIRSVPTNGAGALFGADASGVKSLGD